MPALTAVRMKWLDEYIETHIAHPITLETLARQAGLSPYYFTRVFKDAIGLPPYRYVLHKRIEFACARRDELSIESVALACGFSDNAQFSKQFKKIRGVPPSVYRMACRREEIEGIA